MEGAVNTIVYGAKDEYIVGPVNFKFDGINAKIHGGAVADVFVGVKESTTLLGKYTFDWAHEYSINKGARHRKSKKALLYDSDTKFTAVGGDGNASQVVLDSDQALISSKDSFIIISKNGDITIQSKGGVNLVAEDDVYLQSKSGEIKVGVPKFVIDAAVKHKNLIIEK